MASRRTIASADGSGNNVAHADFGSTGTNLIENFTRDYSDGIATPAGSDRPNARTISNTVHNQDTDYANTAGATGFLVFWGQFLDHDLDLTPGGVSDTIKILGNQRPVSGNDVYPFVSERLPLMFDHAVYPGVDNVIDRPIYLPKLDPGTTIDPAQDTMVHAANILDASVMVAAHSLLTREGNEFTGELSITEVPPDLTPAVLPDGVFPDLVFTIQPANMVFTEPAPITLPNRTGWEPGTLMDLWSINPVTGEFDVVGTAMVSEDGSRVETIEGGLRNTSWGFVTILDLTDTQFQTDQPVCEHSQCRQPSASTTDMFTGGVTESHSFASYTSQGQNRNLNLVFNSLHADVRPIVQFTSTLRCVQVRGSTGPTSQQLSASLFVSSGATESFLSSGTWNLPACGSGNFVRAAVDQSSRICSGFSRDSIASAWKRASWGEALEAGHPGEEVRKTEP